MNNIAIMTGEKKRISGAAVAAFLAAAVFFIMPAETARGCREGLKLCMETAIPSLFPMMFATVFATETGLTQIIGKLSGKAAGRLFLLPDEAVGAVVMSVIGGFPAGAKTVRGLYERGVISREEAGRMYNFCFSAGPAFLIGAVGEMYGNASAGAVLLVIQILSVILTGTASRVLIKSGSTVEHQSARVSVKKKNNTAGAVTAAVCQAADAMLNICLYIILFSVIASVLDGIGFMKLVSAVLVKIGLGRAISEAALPILLEVTSGCAAAVKVGFPAAAFAVGFGGAAVHMQVIAIAGNTGIRYSHFLVARILQGALCAGMAQLYLWLAPESAVAVSAAPALCPTISTTPTGAAVLVVMSVMCLLCMPRFEYGAGTSA